MKNLVILFVILPFLMNAQATVKEELRTLTTYEYSSPNPIPIIAKNSKIYPYHTFDGYSNKPVEKEWKVVTLENDYIKVFVLPEIGGKVWGAIDKVNGEEFIYRNEVIKFRNISMRGPWTSGGIEFNFGIIGHHPSTATPVDYVVNRHDDGSVSCTVGNIDLPSHTQWRVTIRLPKDKSYFETNVNWYNPSPLHQSYYNWMTAAAFAQEDLVFHTPGDQYLEHSGEAKPWPVDEEGRNINAYKENNFGGAKSYHVVGEYNDFFGGYFENDNYGFGHWSEYEEIPGQKLWIWALSRSGGIWEDLLTDTDGQYIEFQAGREFLQYSPGEHDNPMTQAVFSPQTQDTWRELWFPLRDIDGLTDVSEKGVLHVGHNDDKLNVGLNVFQKSKGTILVKSRGETLFKEEFDLDVKETLSRDWLIPDISQYEVSIPELDLSFNSNKEANRIKRPFESNALLNQNDQEKNFYLGWEAYKFREYDKALSYFKSCLSDNSMHQAARSSLAELYFRNNRIDKSLAQIDTLLRIDTRSPHGNFIAGLCYKSQGDFVNALESFGWSARSAEFRSTSYTQMAEVYLIQQKYQQATKYTDKALVFNSQSIPALQVKAIAKRLLGNNKSARQVLVRIKEVDPINHFADYESYLLNNSTSNLESAIQSHRSELAYQTILELAISYVNFGRKQDALNLLEASANNHPLILLWIAYLDESKAEIYISEINKLSSEFVFPYRKETLNALTELIEKNAGWKLKYYQALNLWALKDEVKAKEIFTKLGSVPDEGNFYAARKEIMQGEEDYKSTIDLDKALALDGSALNYHNSSLDSYNDKFYQRAKTIAKEGMQKHPGNYMIEVDAAKAMLHTKDFDQALKILQKVNLLPFEGASEGKQIFEIVNIALAIQKIQAGNYDGAKENLTASREWPENLGVGKPYSPNEIFQAYLMAKISKLKADNNSFEKYAGLALNYFEKNKNYKDPKVALIVDLLKTVKNRNLGASEVLKQITDKQILNLVESKDVNLNDNTILIELIEKALRL